MFCFLIFSQSRFSYELCSHSSPVLWPHVPGLIWFWMFGLTVDRMIVCLHSSLGWTIQYWLELVLGKKMCSIIFRSKGMTGQEEGGGCMMGQQRWSLSYHSVICCFYVCHPWQLMSLLSTTVDIFQIGETPFFVAIDNHYKKIVICVRGTLSLQVSSLVLAAKTANLLSLLSDL